SPEPSGPPPAEEPAPTADEADGHSALLGIPRRAVGAARAGVEMATHPDKLRDAVSRARALADLIVRDELVAAPATSLNVPIGTARGDEVVRVPLDDLKAIKKSLGGTVNDVVLAAASGGLNRMLLERGETPPE